MDDYYQYRPSLSEIRNEFNRIYEMNKSNNKDIQPINTNNKSLDSIYKPIYLSHITPIIQSRSPLTQSISPLNLNIYRSDYNELMLIEKMAIDDVDYKTLINSRGIGGYLKNTLVDIAKSLGIRHYGTKLEIVDNILDYYESKK